MMIIVVAKKKSNYMKIEECCSVSREISFIGVLSNVLNKKPSVDNVQKEVIEATVMDETGDMLTWVFYEWCYSRTHLKPCVKFVK